MVAVGAIAISRLLRRPCARISSRSAFHCPGVVRRDLPGVELQLAGRGARLREGVVRAVLPRQLHRGAQRVEVDGGLDARGQGAAPLRRRRQAQLEEHVLQAHEAQAHRPPAQVGGARGADRVEVQVDHAVELAHGHFHGMRQLLEVEALRPTMARQVDRAQVADGGLAVARDLQDLGAQVRQVHRLAGLPPSGCRRGWTCP